MNDHIHDRIIFKFAKACDAADIKKIRSFLRQGLDPNCVFPTGDRPLHLAMARMSMPMLDILLNAGAMAGLPNEDGLTALELVWEEARHRGQEFAEKATERVRQSEQIPHSATLRQS